MANKIWTPEQRLSVIDYYLKNNTSLRETARRFNLNYITVFEWLKIFRKKGEKGLVSNYHRPWNRMKKEIEDKIILLKEKEPNLTVRKAREILKGEGIDISLKGIWGIWKRAGLSGFRKELLHDDFTKYISWSSEAERKYRTANILYKLGKVRDAAVILNSLPSLPKNELLPKIPDKYLNLKRRVEKVYHLFGEIPIPQYIKNLRRLYKMAMTADLNYSSLRVALAEVVALEWSTRVKEQQLRIKELEKMIKNYSSFSKKLGSYLLFESKFTLLISKGILYSRLLKTREAKRIAQTCHTMLKRLKNPSPYLMLDLGALYNRIQEYKRAQYWFSQGIDRVDDKTRGIYLGSLAFIYLMKGNCKKAFSILNDAQFYKWTRGALPHIYQSLYHILKGNLSDALSSAVAALKYAKSHQSALIVWASMIIAGIYGSLGNEKKSHRMLKQLIPFLKENELTTQLKVVDYILHPNKKDVPAKNPYPSLRLLYLIKNRKYFKAFSYARKKGILMNFYQYILFFPDIVINLMEKGKKTKLPKAILGLPVFNKIRPVYFINFLGPMKITCNQEYLPVRLMPKDSAFLIYLCQKAMEPKKFVNLEEVYANFWPKSEKASRNFSHLLVRLKRALKIPTHLLEISRASGIPTLINQGIYFTTDYQEFEQTLARAKALQRAGEWGFARKEYLRAFKLFRGEPFKKNFDNWSVDTRFRILSEFETEAISFVKSCLEHNNKNDARKILQKVLKIIPDSEEAKRLSDSRMVL